MRQTTRQPGLPLDRADLGRAVFEWLLPAYVLLILAGFVVFRSSAAMVRGNEMTVDRALFAAVNAATLTGFQQRVSTGDYRLPGQVMALVLTVGGTLLSLIVGGLAAVRLLRLPYTGRQVVSAAILAQLVAIGIGALVLAPISGGTFAGAMLGSSAFGNSGLYVGSLPGLLSWQTHAVVLPLAVLGGLGLPVILELVTWAWQRRPLSFHSRTALGMTAAIYLIALLLFIGGQWLAIAPAAKVTAEQWQGIVGSSSFAALNPRTLGLPLEPMYRLMPALQWLVLLLMFIGASPAGTAGGLKTTTLVEVFRGTRRALLGQAPGRIFAIAVVWTGAYLLLIVLGMLLMLVASEQLPADRLLFLVTSAVSNTGLWHDPVSLTGASLYALAALCLAGRLLPLLILYWAAQTTTDAELAVG